MLKPNEPTAGENDNSRLISEAINRIRKIAMPKINNVVIENLNPEFAKELKKFWDGAEVNETKVHWMTYENYTFLNIGDFTA